jgi:hypothetical protein
LFRLAQYRVEWWTSVNKVMNSRFTQKAVFFTILGPRKIAWMLGKKVFEVSPFLPTVVSAPTQSSSPKRCSQRRLSRDCHYQHSREQNGCNAGGEHRNVRWKCKFKSSKEMWRGSFQVTYFCCLVVPEKLLAFLGRKCSIK